MIGTTIPKRRRQLLLALLLTAGVVQAQTLTMDQAAAIARERHGGKVVSVQPTERDGEKAYAVRILQRSGKVITVIIDAEQRPDKAGD